MTTKLMLYIKGAASSSGQHVVTLQRDGREKRRYRVNRKRWLALRKYALQQVLGCAGTLQVGSRLMAEFEVGVFKVTMVGGEQ